MARWAGPDQLRLPWRPSLSAFPALRPSLQTPHTSNEHARCVRGGQRTISRSRFSPSTLWVLGDQIQATRLGGNTITCRAILPALCAAFAHACLFHLLCVETAVVSRLIPNAGSLWLFFLSVLWKDCQFYWFFFVSLIFPTVFVSNFIRSSVLGFIISFFCLLWNYFAPSPHLPTVLEIRSQIGDLKVSYSPVCVSSMI